MRQRISWSEINTWCTCREKWRWMYEVGIVPKRAAAAPAIGSCGHAAVAALLRGRDWGQAIDAWVKERLDEQPLFDEEADEIRAMGDLVKGVVERYTRHYETELFEPVRVECKFEIPIRGLRLTLIGYWDAIVRGTDGHLWLMEHKFPKSRMRSEDDLVLDGQIGTYQYAAHRAGFPVIGTIYNQLLARLPAEPSVNKNGSLSRAAVYTDWETYRAAVVKRGLDPNDYLDMREKLAGYEFFRRTYIYRPMEEIRLFARDLERRIWDLTKRHKHIYRSESFITCGRCAYRELCIETLKGGRNIDYMIENDFEPRKPRKEPEPNDDRADLWLLEDSGTTKEVDG